MIEDNIIKLSNNFIAFNIILLIRN